MNEKLREDDGKRILSKFETHLKDLKEEGLLDVKMEVSGANDASVRDIVSVLNNVFSMRKEGKFKPTKSFSAT